jgi:hypothetical protein
VDINEVAQSPAPGYQTANIAGRVYHRKCLKSVEFLALLTQYGNAETEIGGMEWPFAIDGGIR